MSTIKPPGPKGRGATANPTCRYSATALEAEDDGWNGADAGAPALRTTVTVDATRSIISRNDSPDLPFNQSINAYRGCEHGCIYCYARPSHAWLGLSPGLDFESKLQVKPQAPVLLREALRRRGYRCEPIALGTNTDPYQPIERQWRVTRAILEVLRDCQHPVSIVTKGALIERDLDLLAELARDNLAEVMISVTTLDRGLARRMEPRAAAPQRRIETIARLRNAGVPVGVLVAPVVPVLTDGELEAILAACAEAGAASAGYTLLRLPLEVGPLFEDWLQTHYPLKAAHVMARVRDTRGGRDYDPDFSQRMTGSGDYAELIARRFGIAARRLGLDRRGTDLDVSRFRPPPPEGQMTLF